MPTHRPHILVVGTGAVGGIGRFERLLLTALTDLSERDAFKFTAIWRRRHPGYLEASGGTGSVEGEPETKVPAFAAQIALAVFRTKPDLVLFLHVNLARAAPLARAMGARRYAIVAYGVEVWSPVGALGQRALRAATGVMAISEYTAEQLVEQQGLPRGGIRVVPLALEPHWLEAAAPSVADPIGERRPAASHGPRLLSVSRLEPFARDKGIDHVIRALAEVRSVIPGVRYHVVGDGSDRARLEGVAKQYGVGDAVDFRGSVSHEDLVDEYRRSDAFVLASQREGFGLVFLEAMAYGKPVIARRAGAAAEVIADGNTGVLVDDEHGLAPAIISVLSDEKRARAMGQAGLGRVRDVYSFEAFTSRIEAAISAAIR